MRRRFCAVRIARARVLWYRNNNEFVLRFKKHPNGPKGVLVLEVKGIGVLSGIGMGKAVVLKERSFVYPALRQGSAQQEVSRLTQAAKQFAEEIMELTHTMRRHVGANEADIIAVQVAISEDAGLRSQTNQLVEDGASAEAAITEVCRRYIEMFEQTGNELTSLRAADIRDLRDRMLELLTRSTTESAGPYEQGAILIARDLTPSMTVGLASTGVAAIATELGGRVSHSAILARAMGIPCVVGAAGLLQQVSSGDEVIVDGERGVVIPSPNAREQAAYRARRSLYEARRRELETYRDKPTLTADGCRVQLMANIASADDVQRVREYGADGVGAMRTEFLLMDRTEVPGEDEQAEMYERVANAVPHGTAVIQLFDVGGDKFPPCLRFSPERNPYLGERGIRYLFSHEELMRTQLRALLRASAAHGNIVVMLPFVTGLRQVRRAREILDECKRELDARGVPYDDGIRVGLALETPAMVITADLFAREADFFCIGTNDLVQFMLAADRSDPSVSSFYNPFHPSVLRAVRTAAYASKAARVPVAIVGEAAADERLTPLFLAFGLEIFSVGTAALLSARKAISTWRRDDAATVAQHAMSLPTAKEVEEYLTSLTKAPVDV